MSRDLIIAILASILLHGGVALSGFFTKEKAVVIVVAEEVPTIALDLPPPEPDEPDIVEDAVSDAPPELADLAPPMQNDIPSAIIDSPFVQQIQAPPPPGLNRPTGSITIPTSTRPSVTAGKGLGNLFDLAALDKRPTPTVQPQPQYPFDLKRSGIEGEVLVSFIVDSTGSVRDPFVVRSSNPAFDEVVLTTVLRWKFRPGQKGGVAVNTRNVQILIPFKLKDNR
ncbi:MAG: energy transducer TonB [Burkholderiales bacterium]|nr:energy transducer TonB [Opitutaceae bacterium]